MNIGIIGNGRIGSGLATHWAKKHRIFFGSRRPEEAADVVSSIQGDVQVGTLAEAAKFGDVVVLAVPWAAAYEVLDTIGPLLAGKVLIETTNPLSRGPAGMALAVGPDTSAAEEIAKKAPGAHVVKAFNTTYSQLVHNGGQIGSQHVNVFFCGDDASAKITTGQLAQEIGFDPVDIGPLRMARFLEPFAVIVIQLQRMPGMSSDMGYKMIPR